MEKQGRLYHLEDARTMRGCTAWRRCVDERLQLTKAPVRRYVARGKDGNEQQRLVNAFVDRGSQQIVAFQGTFVAPNRRLVSKIVADQTRQALDEQVDPPFDIAGGILIVKVSIANKNIIGRGHGGFFLESGITLG